MSIQFIKTVRQLEGHFCSKMLFERKNLNCLFRYCIFLAFCLASTCVLFVFHAHFARCLEYGHLRCDTSQDQRIVSLMTAQLAAVCRLDLVVFDVIDVTDRCGVFFFVICGFLCRLGSFGVVVFVGFLCRMVLTPLQFTSSKNKI